MVSAIEAAAAKAADLHKALDPRYNSLGQPHAGAWGTESLAREDNDLLSAKDNDLLSAKDNDLLSAKDNDLLSAKDDVE
jgi:hypothetical protein